MGPAVCFSGQGKAAGPVPETEREGRAEGEVEGVSEAGVVECVVDVAGDCGVGGGGLDGGTVGSATVVLK